VGKLTEEKFLLILNADASSRLLTFSDLRKFLCAFFVYSLVMIGVAYKVVNGGNIGWENLSPFWQWVFRLEILLFILHAFSIFFSMPNRPFSWRFSSIAVVIFMYKAAFDPFVAFMMFAKDIHLYDAYFWTALYSIAACVLFHLFFLYFWIRKRIQLQEINHLDGKTYNKEISASVIGFFVVLSSIFTRHYLQGEGGLLLLFLLIVFLCVGILAGVCQYVLIAWRTFRIPTFIHEMMKTKGALP